MYHLKFVAFDIKECPIASTPFVNLHPISEKYRTIEFSNCSLFDFLLAIEFQAHHNFYFVLQLWFCGTLKVLRGNTAAFTLHCGSVLAKINIAFSRMYSPSYKVPEMYKKWYSNITE